MKSILVEMTVLALLVMGGNAWADIDGGVYDGKGVG